MYITITKEFLVKKGACKEWVEMFEKQFPEGAELNEENIAKMKKYNSIFNWEFYEWIIHSGLFELLYKFCGVIGSEGIVDSRSVTDSKGVDWSRSVVRSRSVAGSDGVANSRGVVSSNGVADSEGVDWSRSVTDSKGVDWSRSVVRSRGVVRSRDVDWSNGVTDSEGVDWSRSVTDSKGVVRSRGIVNSFGIYNCAGIVNALFCANKLPEHSVFGALVERERFEEIQKELFEKLGDWRPVFQIKRNNKNIYLTNRQAWSGMPKKAIQYVKSLPEYDAEMFYTITGIL